MPIAHDVTTYAESATSATAASADFTIASTADRYAYIGFNSADGGGAATHSGTDIEGTSATQIGAGATQFFGVIRGTAWGLTGPASGSARTLNATAADSEDEITAGVSVYNGVDQTTPTRDSDISDGLGFGSTSISPSHTLTTVSGDVCVMSVKIWLDTTSAITVSAGDWDTTRLNQTNNLTSVIHLEKVATGTSTTIGATLSFGSANVGWIAESVAIIPASGGSTVSGAGSITGTATVTGAGASTASASGSVSSVATATGASRVTAASAGSITAVATATGRGGSFAAGDVYSAGVLTMIGVPGGVIESAAGSITATATVQGVGASIASGAFDADASATEGGIGGVLIMVGHGLATIQSAFSSAGVSGVVGRGASTNSGTFSSAAASTVVGRGQSTNSGDFYSQGVSSVIGVGSSTTGSEANGYITATSSVQGVGATVVSAAGSISGSCQVTGIGAAQVIADGDIEIVLNMIGTTETSAASGQNTGGRGKFIKRNQDDEFLLELATMLAPHLDDITQARH